MFHHIPHPHHLRRRNSDVRAVKVADQHVGFNGRIAIRVTDLVSTMQAAYVFAVIGMAGIVGAFGGNVWLVLVVGAISGYFLQLVFLPILGVGQKVSEKAADKRSQQVFDDVEAILHNQSEHERHLQHQDERIDKLIALVKGKAK